MPHHPSASQSIIENAQYHTDLLKSLDELAYAPSALSQQSSYLNDLHQRIGKHKAAIDKLAKVTKKERKEHENFRDSKARKLAAKMTGRSDKFVAKQEKEEREYVEALENEMKERNVLKTVETMIAEGNVVRDDLSKKCLELSEIHNKIGGLYERVFGGPTEEFPRDDQLEYQLDAAQKKHDRLQDAMNVQSRAVHLLNQADGAMQSCLMQMQTALSYSTWDVYGGGSMADWMERTALGEAAVAASRAQMLFEQARQTSPEVRNVGPIRVYDISMFGDVFFDNIFSDIAAHQKMEANRDELYQTHQRLRRELQAATARCERIGPELVEAAEELTQSRNALFQFRRETFENVSRSRNERSGDANGNRGIDGFLGEAMEDTAAPPPSYPGSETGPPSFPEPTPSGSNLQFSPPSGPPPILSPQPSAQMQYAPPSGPPPTLPHDPSTRTQYSPPAVPPPGQTETSTTSVPGHWGSKNPFALELMRTPTSEQEVARAPSASNAPGRAGPSSSGIEPSESTRGDREKEQEK